MKASFSLRVFRVLNLIGFIIILYMLDKMINLTVGLQQALAHIK